MRITPVITTASPRSATRSRHAVTLLELLVVLVIISILSTVAVGVYSKEVTRARFARARQEIRTLEIAITQYEVDTGQFPPSGRGSFIASGNWTFGDYIGTGNLQLALRSSFSGDPANPLNARWNGPYVDWDINRMGDANGVPLTATSGTSTVSVVGAIAPIAGGAINGGSIADIHFLDPWGTPYYYVRASDYASAGAQLPSTNPLAATEVYFNPTTFQIISFGPDLTSLDVPQRGLSGDDITNFRSPAF
ncbi:prepilin-type N-terminal cleavage/methylation domain-containing protein [bacterium]|nr:prepilin-type N-terminal cleavage/methylation domain-containing protein [bacterium]